MRTTSHHCVFASFVGIAVVFGSIVANAASFTPLGDLAGGRFYSSGLAISDDGSTIVGASETEDGNQAFRWSRATGMEPLGSLTAAGESFALAVSADGSTIVGRAENGSGTVAFMWTEVSRSMNPISDLRLTRSFSRAGGVSADGSVVVGDFTAAGTQQAYSWSSASGFVELSGISNPAADQISFATEISSDGSTIIGSGEAPSGISAAYQKDDGPVIFLGHLPGGTESNAYGVSIDGSVIVGQGDSSTGYEAFRWDAANGIVGLGDLTEGVTRSGAWDVSGDGRVVVGEGVSPRGREAFVWTEAGGMQSLEVLLASLGVDVTGWELMSAHGISADGTSIAGLAMNPDGQVEAFLAVIPEPSTALLIGLGLFGLGGRRRPHAPKRLMGS